MEEAPSDMAKEMADEATAREHARYRVAAYADVMGTGNVLLYQGITNVSVGGMCFDGAPPADQGDEVEVVLNFPRAEKTVPVTGQVVWVADRQDDNQAKRVGLRWIGLGAEDRATLAHYIGDAMTGREPDSAQL